MTLIYIVGNGASTFTPQATATAVVDVFGAGMASDTTGNGGMGGGWARKNAYSMTSGTPISFSLGAPGLTSGQTGGDTWWAAVGTLLANGAGSVTTPVGDSHNSANGQNQNTQNGSTGGTGCSGPNGGGNLGGGTLVGAGGGGGGGGNGGGAAGADVGSASTNGANGGVGFAGGTAGVGGVGTDVSGTSGAPGSGGGGGAVDAGNGAAGRDDYDNGGGGGGAGGGNTGLGGVGGTPGGGAGANNTGGSVSRGGYSLIRISYTGTDPNRIITLGSIAPPWFLRTDPNLMMSIWRHSEAVGY